MPVRRAPVTINDDMFLTVRATRIHCFQRLLFEHDRRRRCATTEMGPAPLFRAEFADISQRQQGLGERILVCSFSSM